MNPDLPLQGKKAAYFTLGCKLNFAETSTIARQLEPLKGTVFLGKDDLISMKEQDAARRMSVILTERPRAELMTCFDVAAIGNSDIGIALTPHLNLVDTDKFIPAQSKSFLLLDYNENQELGGDLEEIFGECMDKFNVGENYIYVWDYDVAANDFGGRSV